MFVTVNRTLLLAAGFGLTALIAHGNFYEPGPSAPESLPADKLYPQGQVFPFGGFSGIPERDRTAGFNTYGPLYGHPQDFLEQARKNGLFAIYHVGIEMNFLERNGEPKRILSQQEIKEEIARQVSAVADNETIAWWYLSPEELRYWHDDEMAYLEAATEAIRENDPLKRPIWMYEPNHRNVEALMKTNQYLDIVGKGVYVNHSKQKHNRIWGRWSMEQEVAAVDGLGGNRVPILVPEMFVDPEPGERELISRWVRHDIYLGMVNGAKGVMIFSLFKRANFSTFPEYYLAYSAVARELTGQPQLGKVFLFGERRDDVALVTPEDVPMIAPQMGVGGMTEEVAYQPVCMANIAYGPDRYLFLVNSAETPVPVALEGIPADALFSNALNGEATSMEPRPVSLTLAPLEVVAWKISPPPAATLEAAANEG